MPIKKVHVLICVMMAATLFNAPTAQAISYPGTIWSMTGRAKLSLASLFSLQVFLVDMRLGHNFGGMTSDDPQSNQVTIRDYNGDLLYGTYEPKGAGAKLEFTDQQLATYIQQKITRGLAANGITGAVQSVAVTRTKKANVKGKHTKTAEKIDLKIVAQAVATVVIGEGDNAEVKEFKTKLDLAGKSERPNVGAATVEGSMWDLWFKDSVSLKKVGKIKGAGSMRMVLGPDDVVVPSVAAGAWRGWTDLGSFFNGTFTVKKKKATLALTPSEWKTYLHAMVHDALAKKYPGKDITNIEITIGDTGGTANVNPGKCIKLTIKIKFVYAARIGGVQQSNAASYKLNGKGEPGV